jgi:hypothetical protein
MSPPSPPGEDGGPPSPEDLEDAAAGAAAGPGGGEDESGRWRWHTHALVVSAFVVLSVLCYWHVWWGGASHVATQSGSDGIGAVWVLSWFSFALTHGHNPFFSDYANYPYGVNFVANPGVQLLALLVEPVTLLWGPVAALNVLLTLGLGSAGTGAFYLVRRVTGWGPGAFVAGLLYEFSPVEFNQGKGDLNLVWLVLSPLMLLILYEVVVRQRPHPLRWGALLGVLAACQFLISSEYLASTALFAAIALVVLAIQYPHRVRATARRVAGALAAAAATALALLAYPLWFMLWGPASLGGQIVVKAQAFRADLLGAVIPGSLELLRTARTTTISSNFSQSSYLGLGMLAVLVVGVVAYRRVALVRTSAIVAGCAFVLALGGSLVIIAYPYPRPSAIPLPGAILAHLPLLSDLLPVRFSVFVILFGSIVVAYVLEQVHRSVLASHGPGRAVLATVGVAAIAVIPLIPSAPYQTYRVRTPAGFSEVVRSLPVGAPVLVYPAPDFPTSQALLWQGVAGIRIKIIGGVFAVRLYPGTKNTTVGHSGTTNVVTTTFFTAQEGVRFARTSRRRDAILADLNRWHVRYAVAVPTALKTAANSQRFLVWIFGRPVRQVGRTEQFAVPRAGFSG